MKNLRTYIVKALYPMCSQEVQILIDQMQNNSDKFVEIIEDTPYRTASPWAKALQRGNFELIDHTALRHQLKLLKGKHAKQLILEGLLETNEVAQNRDANLNMFDSILKTATQGKSSQPTTIRMSKTQYEVAKKLADAKNAKRTAKARK